METFVEKPDFALEKLARYCECFASGNYCDGCNCADCKNTEENEVERKAAIASYLERLPNAPKPKITGSKLIAEETEDNKNWDANARDQSASRGIASAFKLTSSALKCVNAWTARTLKSSLENRNDRENLLSPNRMGQLICRLAPSEQVIRTLHPDQGKGTIQPKDMRELCSILVVVSDAAQVRSGQWWSARSIPICRWCVPGRREDPAIGSIPKAALRSDLNQRVASKFWGGAAVRGHHGRATTTVLFPWPRWRRSVARVAEVAPLLSVGGICPLTGGGDDGTLWQLDSGDCADFCGGSDDVDLCSSRLEASLLPIMVDGTVDMSGKDVPSPHIADKNSVRPMSRRTLAFMCDEKDALISPAASSDQIKYYGYNTDVYAKQEKLVLKNLLACISGTADLAVC
ncbi:hypothetical protein RJ639_040897 [Escallonia herrerae]|uniref:Tesmin/TSO1-like CXC domain-containing protein n=1 Tax=Escallonia herrerae TaxID=1293975 RepID=A0AA88WT41_9ASTE|nr:hypothetical protein RJ639_040897 [Escallonia herrerae]